MKKGKLYKIVIPEIPPSQNCLLRLHYHKRHEIYKKWEWWIWGEIKSRGIEGVCKKVKVVFVFPDKKRRDLDNYASFQPILNAIKHSGLCKDDNFLEVEITWKAKIGKEAKTEIYLQIETKEEKGRQKWTKEI